MLCFGDSLATYVLMAIYYEPGLAGSFGFLYPVVPKWCILSGQISRLSVDIGTLIPIFVLLRQRDIQNISREKREYAHRLTYKEIRTRQTDRRVKQYKKVSCIGDSTRRHITIYYVKLHCVSKMGHAHFPAQLTTIIIIIIYFAQHISHTCNYNDVSQDEQDSKALMKHL